MTMHAAKGLEFHTVYLPDLNEGKLPSRQAVTPEGLEEERRMFYVAMTRAQKELHLLYCGKGNGKEKPSGIDQRAAGVIHGICKGKLSV